MLLPPKAYGLNSRVILEELGPKHIAIVKKVKSRIIQKDAHKIIEMAEKIRGTNPGVAVSLICNNNICSKSVKLLNENGVNIRMRE